MRGPPASSRSLMAPPPHLPGIGSVQPEVHSHSNAITTTPFKVRRGRFRVFVEERRALPRFRHFLFWLSQSLTRTRHMHRSVQYQHDDSLCFLA